ncbi:52 kDa repressor of the inhibitor of the protein kinase [Eumeta japonica]|uniref:52 kDa repressor of the inhibitor of the protein kinase n=1 Tax=Eumeta variegata TaxID=151549 RepID=A0A4C1VVY0_EUMVA|nr:52 kDa repressor of the inhibitor of the protein kinase [Eumeta japonica]
MFVGFVELKGLDAKSIAYCIDEFLTKKYLNPAEKCVGFGFDGCLTMSEKDGGVQAILRKKYTKALFFHSKYSALLEPVVNALQSIALDVVKASQHVIHILQLPKSHRDNPERVTDEIIKDATVVAKKVGLEEDITSMPRIVGKQRHRSNHPAESPSEFWKRSLIIPYLEYVITSLETRFAEENTPSFALSKLHPAQMQTMSLENLTGTCQTIALFYNLPNIKIEVELWQQFWHNKPNSTDQTVVDILKEAKTFFPDTENALKILIALPCTTCMVERSFSSLRRLKTWLRSTMSENRLNGLAI